MKNFLNLKKIDELIVTVFYLGKIKKAPGTFGSAAALLILFTDSFNLWCYSLILAAILWIVSHNSIKRYEKENGSDHSSIVIDEVIGMLLVFSNPYLVINYYWVGICFLSFRVFDILKPFPINKINDQNGALFVVADDVAAGLFTLILVQFLQLGYRILPFFIKFL
jgi:phosphatidylglycerophosphatase A